MSTTAGWRGPNRHKLKIWPGFNQLKLYIAWSVNFFLLAFFFYIYIYLFVFDLFKIFFCCVCGFARTERVVIRSRRISLDAISGPVFFGRRSDVLVSWWGTRIDFVISSAERPSTVDFSDALLYVRTLPPTRLSSTERRRQASWTGDGGVRFSSSLRYCRKGVCRCRGERNSSLDVFSLNNYIKKLI